jgi:hypothetical protein
MPSRSRQKWVLHGAQSGAEISVSGSVSWKTSNKFCRRNNPRISRVSQLSILGPNSRNSCIWSIYQFASFPSIFLCNKYNESHFRHLHFCMKFFLWHRIRFLRSDTYLDFFFTVDSRAAVLSNFQVVYFFQNIFFRVNMFVRPWISDVKTSRGECNQRYFFKWNLKTYLCFSKDIRDNFFMTDMLKLNVPAN